MTKRLTEHKPINPIALLPSLVLLASVNNANAGTWTQIANQPPDSVGTMLQLTDGTVMAQGWSNASNWMKLTPDSTGSYINGAWSNLASMSTPRLYFASNVLPNGDVWVLGGEYSDPNLDPNTTNTGEKYSVTGNTWSPIATYPEQYYGDVPSMLLPGGKILAGSIAYQTSYIYDIAGNTWGPAINKVYNDVSDEENWVKIAGGKILNYDLFQSSSTGGGYAELFDPATLTWSSISPSDGSASGFIPQLSSNDVGSELGPALRLCDGRAFIVGAGAGSPLTAHTALYDPATNNWSAGPDVPNNYIADDAPAVVLPNCHVMFSAEIGHFNGPAALFDFDPTANTITQVTVPAALSSQLTVNSSFGFRLLMLPTGQVLLSVGDNQPWIYTPDSGPNPSLAPVVNKVSYTGGGTFNLLGRRVTGQSAGSAYGDDVESDENYPIVALKKGNATYYAKTFNWDTTDVGTGTTLINTSFCLNPGTPSGNYSLYLSAAGFRSLPVAVNIPNNAGYCQ